MFWQGVFIGWLTFAIVCVAAAMWLGRVAKKDDWGD